MGGGVSPHVYYSPALRCWVLGDEWSVGVNGCRLTVPQGFMFDMASVPRIVWPLISSFDLGTASPLVHDWGYQHQGRMCPGLEWTRKQVDQNFNRMMRDEGVTGWKRRYAYYAVRWFGWLAFRAKGREQLPRANRDLHPGALRRTVRRLAGRVPQ